MVVERSEALVDFTQSIQVFLPQKLDLFCTDSFIAARVVTLRWHTMLERFIEERYNFFLHFLHTIQGSGIEKVLKVLGQGEISTA